MAKVRYFVRDVAEAVSFYCDHLGFDLKQQFGSTIAILKRDDLTLWVAGPEASASRPMLDGRQPVPGGWNRFVLESKELSTLVDKLRASKVKFRNDIVTGPGGQQILCEDPSGNVIELFQPAG